MGKIWRHHIYIFFSNVTCGYLDAVVVDQDLAKDSPAAQEQRDQLAKQDGLPHLAEKQIVYDDYNKPFNMSFSYRVQILAFLHPFLLKGNTLR